MPRQASLVVVAPVPPGGGISPLMMRQHHHAAKVRQHPCQVTLSHSLDSRRFHLFKRFRLSLAQDQHRVSPCFIATHRISHPCASPVANQINSRQGFPRYLPTTASSCAAVLHVMPSLRLPSCLVSVPRDSKAGDLPGMTLQRTPDYLFRGNGSTALHTAPWMGAVTRLSYAVTRGFPRCRLSQVSPLRPGAFLHP